MNRVNITPSDIRSFHPEGLQCDTDSYYTTLANNLNKEIAPYFEGFLSPSSIASMAIRIALYFEDQVSDTYLFKTYSHFCNQKLNTPLPFFHNDPMPTIQKELKMIIWMSICSEKQGAIINPGNPGLNMLAEHLFNYISLDGQLDNTNNLYHQLPANEDLADYIFSEEALTDQSILIELLEWISYRSFLGRWYTNDQLRKSASGKGAELLLRDINRKVEALSKPAWPISVKPQHILSQMVRFDMDPTDPLAQQIDQIDFLSPTTLRLIEKHDQSLLLQDTLGQNHEVLISSFHNLNDKTLQHNGYVKTMLIYHNGMWSSLLHSHWADLSSQQWDELCQFNHQNQGRQNKERFQQLVDIHQGQQLFCFNNKQSCLDWIAQNLDLQTRNSVRLPLNDSHGIFLFLATDGSLQIGTHTTALSLPNNPTFNTQQADRMAITFLISPTICSSECLHYLIDHQGLAHAQLTSTQGTNNGLSLTQDNMEFLARCFRRDINW